MRVKLDSLAAKMIRDMQKAEGEKHRPAAELVSRAVRLYHSVARGDAGVVLGPDLSKLNAELDRQRDKPH